MKKIIFTIGNKNIPYFLGENCLAEIALKIHNLQPDQVFVITDEVISSLYREEVLSAFQNHFQCVWLTAAAGEKEKTIDTIASLCSRMLLQGATRKSIIIAFGGGVIGNMAGLIASLLFRGIRFVHLPSTLLSMHDSVTSAKQAVNHAYSKNILGTYYYPEAIFADIAFLNSLPEEHLKSGKAELIKNALIFGGDQYQQIKSVISGIDSDQLIKMVELGIAAKASLLATDPFEKKEAIIFEYGHTIGHALELYFEGGLTHGEAVAMGMKYAAVISHRLGYLSAECLQIHRQLIDLLPASLPHQTLDREAIMRFIMHDNKRGYLQASDQEVPMILLRTIGETVQNEAYPHLTRVPVATVDETLATL